MKKSTIIVLAIVGVILVFGLSIVSWWVGTYNSLVTLDEGVKQAWSQVQNQYQRRIDLIPNLVSTVKGYAEHESEVFEKVAEARANVGKINVTADVLNDPELFKKLQAAQTAMSGALSRLLAVAENYPQLKANENFLKLQDELAGTENRIATERRHFNEITQGYNTKVRMFPASIIASMSGFGQKQYFESDAGADKAPKVDFKK